MYELVREKYTGKRIIRQGSTISMRWSTIGFDSRQDRRFSSISLLSNSNEETPHRRSLTGASPPPPGHPFSFLEEGSGRVIPRPLTTLREEEAEDMSRESAQRKTSDYVTRSNSEAAEVSLPQQHLTKSRRRSILKVSPSVSCQPSEDKRGVHHVQFSAL